MNTDFWIKAQALLSQQKKAVLIAIVRTDGSAPGKTGFKMMVFPSGELIGTVGGGNTEFLMVEKAKKMLKTGDTTPILKRFEHRDDAGESSSGMICSGANTMVSISLDNTQIETVARISKSIQQDRAFRLCISPDGLAINPFSGDSATYNFLEQADGKWQYEEDINVKNILYIIGGGHVGLALSHVSEFLGFHTVVIDDRKDLDAMEHNRFAHEKHIIDFSQIDAYVKEGDGSFAVVMTSGHKHDETVLKKLVNKRLKYVGMIASKKKKEQIYQNLIQSGIDKEKLESVHSPIGLSINSITPEEIAISIMAEIIKVKNTYNAWAEIDPDSGHHSI